MSPNSCNSFPTIDELEDAETLDSYLLFKCNAVFSGHWSTELKIKQFLFL